MTALEESQSKVNKSVEKAKKVEQFNDVVESIQEEAKANNTLSDNTKEAILSALNATYDEFEQDQFDASTKYKGITSTEVRMRRFLVDKLDKVFIDPENDQKEAVYQFMKDILVSESQGE